MDDITLLLNMLPPKWKKTVGEHTNLTEIIVDVGRPLEVRSGKKKTFFSQFVVTDADLQAMLKRCGEFGIDNRAGIDGTLHRISRVITRTGAVSGLTCRVGRAFPGCVRLIEDLVQSGESILLVGPPGVGKTTKLRDVARMASTELDRAVVIVDTSNEIAGDGLTPHGAVGWSRRMQVPRDVPQYDIMVEAVENHAPEVIVVDEVSKAKEVEACLSIAQRGVQLIATAHGRCLKDVYQNPELRLLLGGIEKATVSDKTMMRRGTGKTITERSTNPCFTIVVEILSYNEVAIHRDVARVIDETLRGCVITPEERRLLPDGRILTIPATIKEPQIMAPPPPTPPAAKPEPRSRRRTEEIEDDEPKRSRYKPQKPSKSTSWKRRRR